MFTLPCLVLTPWFPQHQELLFGFILSVVQLVFQLLKASDFAFAEAFSYSFIEKFGLIVRPSVELIHHHLCYHFLH